MQTRWSEEAAADLAKISGYIAKDSTQAASQVIQTLLRGVSSLSKLPRRGRAGRAPGTRELVLTPLPYVVVYQVTDHAVEVLRVFHGAQDWP